MVLGPLLQGGQHVPTLGMAAEVVPIEVRQVVFPINMLAYASQSMAISYSFTFMVSEAPKAAVPVRLAPVLSTVPGAPAAWQHLLLLAAVECQL